MDSEIVIKRDCKCAGGGPDCANLEGIMEHGWRYAVGDDDCVNLQAVMDRVWRYTSMP
jgi:hypothetical protein